MFLCSFHFLIVKIGISKNVTLKFGYCFTSSFIFWMLLYAVDTDWSSSDANDMYFLCLDVMSQVLNHTYSHIFPIFLIFDLSLFCSQEYPSLVFSLLLIHHFISRSCLSATFISRYLPLLSENTTGVKFLLPTFSGYGLLYIW